MVEAARSAEAAEALRSEIEAVKAASADEHVEYELRLAGARNVTAAKALLAEHGNDVGSLKEAEPWMFSAAAPAAGATGLPSVGAATDRGRTLRRWERIAGLDGDDEWEGLTDGELHRLHQGLHGHHRPRVPAGGHLERAELRAAHDSRRAQRQGGHDPEDLGDGPRGLHAKRRLQDRRDHLRVRDEDLQLRPRHPPHGRRHGRGGGGHARLLRGGGLGAAARAGGAGGRRVHVRHDRLARGRDREGGGLVVRQGGGRAGGRSAT